MSDFYGYDPNSPLDRWRQRKAALTNNTALRNTQGSQGKVVPIGTSARLPEDVIAKAVRDNTEQPSFGNYPKPTDPSGANLGGNPRFVPDGNTPPQGKSLMDQLMEQLAQTYEPRQHHADTSAYKAQFNEYVKSLDNALAERLGALGNVRNQAQSNYATSNRNLADMFGATAQNIATQGSQRFTDITNQQKAGLTAVRDQSIGNLQADRAKAAATRAAMLKSLGIEAAGAAVDPGEETLNRGIQTLNERSASALTGAENAGAANQAYNQSVVNSVNQQGAERRAALTQQLQAIQNQLGMAEADMKSDHEQKKAQLQMEWNQAQQQADSATNEQDYNIWKDRQSTIMDLYKTLSDREMEEAKLAHSGAGQATKVQGFSGLAQDLLNSGIDEQTASNALSALSEVISSPYMQGIHPDDGYARADIISRELVHKYGIPSVIANHVATNYTNLGNNSYYTAQGG